MTKTYPLKLLIVVVIHFIIFAVLGISRHWGYMTSINDLGCFDQATWGILHKGFPLNTSAFSKPINWFGFHFHPILYFFVPFYYLFPTAHWFAIAQSAALSFAAIPIFLLARQVSKSENQAILWAIVYLFNPFLLSANAWDFHPVSFAVPFIALAFLAIAQRKPLLFILANLVLLLCQEHFGLTVACFGLLYGIKNREFQASILCLTLGVISVFLVLAVIMPNLSPTKEHIMITGYGNVNTHLNRYSWLGHSLKEIVKTTVFSFWDVLKIVFIELGGLLYLKALLLPVMFTVLAAPLFLLPMGTDLMANMLAASPLPRSICSYHSIAIIPVLIVAAIYGCQNIARHCSFLPTSRLMQYICCATFTLGYLYAPLPLPFSKNIWHPVQLMPEYDYRESLIKTLIEKQSIVSAQANIASHFSQREKIYSFPNRLNESDYVILWLNSPTTEYDYHSSFNDLALIGQYLQMHPLDYLSAIEKLLADKNFNIVYWNDPWLVFKREPKISTDEHKNQVLTKIKTFRKQILTSLRRDIITDNIPSIK